MVEVRRPDGRERMDNVGKQKGKKIMTDFRAAVYTWLYITDQENH